VKARRSQRERSRGRRHCLDDGENFPASGAGARGFTWRRIARRLMARPACSAHSLGADPICARSGHVNPAGAPRRSPEILAVIKSNATATDRSRGAARFSRARADWFGVTCSRGRRTARERYPRAGPVLTGFWPGRTAHPGAQSIRPAIMRPEQLICWNKLRRRRKARRGPVGFHLKIDPA